MLSPVALHAGSMAFEIGDGVTCFHFSQRFDRLLEQKLRRFWCLHDTLCVSLCVQISDLLAELADERSTSESASQLLETETSERLRLERDMKDLQVHTHTVTL